MNRRERMISSMGTLARAAKVTTKLMAQVCKDAHRFNVALDRLDKSLRKRIT